MSALTIRAVDPAEREAWQATYRGYRDFYEKEHDPAVFDTVWGWLHDPAHETRGLVAELDGEIVGLAHYRSFARPLAGSTGIYLDDLFTTPANATARSLYDKVATQTPGVTYDITV